MWRGYRPLLGFRHATAQPQIARKGLPFTVSSILTLVGPGRSQVRGRDIFRNFRPARCPQFQNNLEAVKKLTEQGS
jgi:hypothetical protein